MISLTVACIIGGCLDIPIDTRPIHRQILDDQFGRKEQVQSCYINGKFHKQCPEDEDNDDQYHVGPRDPRVRF